MAVIASCKKGDQTLGINLLPGINILDTRYFQDSISIGTTIYSDMKIRVDRPTYNLLGSFNDPVFGRTDASFAAQFRMPYYPAYSTTAVLDSVVLRMYYKKIYGDTVSTQYFNVYELSGGLSFDAKYLSSFNLKSIAYNTPIGTGSFIPKFRTDSAKTDTTQQVISVRLNKSFGSDLLKIDSLQMVSNDVFLNVFKGLLIDPLPINRKGTLVSLSPNSTDLTVYFHDATRDTLGYAYYVSKNSAVVSGFVHDFTKARFVQNLNKEVDNDSLLYIQPNGGTKVKIKIPQLSTWKDSSNYIINRAALIFHADTIMSDYLHYSMPSRLYLKVITDTGDEAFPKDSELSSSYYGGYYDKTTSSYIFNITQHLQQLIKGVDSAGNAVNNNGFYLVPADRTSSAQRVVLKSSNSSLPVKLDITYTRYKK